MEYLDPAEISERKQTEAPRNPYVMGYGSKIPTSHMVRVANRWHRVYVIQFSNSGTAYILRRGQPLYIATGVL